LLQSLNIFLGVVSAGHYLLPPLGTREERRKKTGENVNYMDTAWYSEYIFGLHEMGRQTRLSVREADEDIALCHGLAWWDRHSRMLDSVL
jgi:hypothetical protein